MTSLILNSVVTGTTTNYQNKLFDCVFLRGEVTFISKPSELSQVILATPCFTPTFLRRLAEEYQYYPSFYRLFKSRWHHTCHILLSPKKTELDSTTA